MPLSAPRHLNRREQPGPAARNSDGRCGSLPPPSPSLPPPSTGGPPTQPIPAVGAHPPPRRWQIIWSVPDAPALRPTMGNPSPSPGAEGAGSPKWSLRKRKFAPIEPTGLMARKWKPAGGAEASREPIPGGGGATFSPGPPVGDVNPLDPSWVKYSPAAILCTGQQMKPFFCFVAETKKRMLRASGLSSACC